MDTHIQQRLDNLHSEDKAVQNEAFFAVLALTDQPVDWAYAVWDELVNDLRHSDNHRRAIAAQVLCNLAKSDPDQRILRDFDALLNVTRDERFVTARHCLQALWKVGVSGDDQRQRLLEGLERRFNECVSEKNCTLIRYDILQSLRNVYEVVPDAAIKAKALQWIELEADPKYRKKYATLWRS